MERGDEWMRISVGCDRAGFRYKEKLLAFLNNEGYETEDVGSFSEEVCDYPLFAEKAAKLVAEGRCDAGILICGSGEGMAIAANKIRGIRCGIAYNDETAALLREHNNANMVAFGAGFMAYEDVERRTEIFLNTGFAGNYHESRVGMISEIENRQYGR